MNILVAINILVFAAAFSLFALETGIALLNLIDFRSYGDKAREYILKSWAISGTFIVFYVVNFEATFPLLLTAAGTLYIVPVIAAGLCIVFRNAFIAYSEYADEKSSRKRYTSVYAVATILAVLIAISVLSSTVTGSGINLSSLSINYFQMVINPYNILMFLCAAVVSLVGASIFLGIERPLGIVKVKFLIASLLIILATFLLASYLYAPFIIHGLLAKGYSLLPAAIMLVAVCFFYVRGQRKWMNILTFIWLASSVAGFSVLGRPNLFGGAVSIDTMLTSQSGMVASLAATAGIFTVIVVGIGLLLYANGKGRRRRE